jgi:hypothetical protein
MLGKFLSHGILIMKNCLRDKFVSKGTFYVQVRGRTGQRMFSKIFSPILIPGINFLIQNRKLLSFIKRQKIDCQGVRPVEESKEKFQYSMILSAN